MKYFTLSILVMAVNLNLSAQSIRGKVVDTQNQPVEFANVALYSLPDTVNLTHGVVTDSTGFYRILEDIPVGDYRLRASFLGYKAATVDFRLSAQNSPIELNFTLQLDETLLNELVVEGQRPAMKVEAGKLSYHIPTLLRNKPVTNAYDALKEIPGVMEQNEQITLMGASGMTILLNGRKTSMTYAQLMTLLRSTPLSQVEDVEIMYSAPPQYNIRGAAINVILKQQTGEDDRPLWQGEVAGEYRQRTHAGGNGRANITYRAKRASFDALYSYGNYHTFNKEELTAEHTMNNTVYAIDQLSEGTNTYQVHNTRLAFDYVFDNKDKMDVSYTGMFDTSSSNRTATTHISGTPTDTKTTSEGPSSMHNIRADYTFHFRLNIGADYTFYKDDSEYFMQNSVLSSLPAQVLTYKSKQEIRRNNFYGNQSHSLQNKWGVNYGLSYSGAQSKNRSNALMDNAEFEEASFDTQQQEDIWNFFAGFSKSFSERLSLEASLALEYYKSTETSKGITQKLWDDTAWFPTLNASYRPSLNHTFQLAVSSDKSYPSYWSLNPSIYYFSSYGVTYGNPHLRPQRNYSVGLTYIFKRKYVFRPYMNYMPDYFVQLPYQSPHKLEQIFMEQNYTFRQNIGLLGVVPFNIGKRISSRIVGNVMYWHEKDDEFFDISFDRKTVMGVLQMNHDIALSAKPDIKMNVSGYVTTPSGIQGIYDLGASGNLSGALTWTFDKNRATLIFKTDDVLGTRTPVASIDYQGQKSQLKAFRDTRTFSLSLVYRFGGYEESDRKEVDSSRFGTN